MGIVRVALIVAMVAGASSLSCVDVEGGDTGFYSSPCRGSFRQILLCDRESGGTDPSGTTPTSGDTGDGTPTCSSVCQQLAGCGAFPSSEIGACTADCLSENIPQSILDCIHQAGCNYEQCFSTN
jgi:hypothetical protein